MKEVHMTRTATQQPAIDRPILLRILGTAAVLLLIVSALSTPVHSAEPKLGGQLATAQKLADSWTHERIYVEPALRTTYGDSTVASLTKMAEEPSPAVWVAVMSAPDGDFRKLSEILSLAAELHGEQGTYVLLEAELGMTRVVTNATGERGSLITSQDDRYLWDPDHSMSPVEWLRDILMRLKNPQEGEHKRSRVDDLRYYVYSEPVKSALWAAAALTVLLLGVYGIAKRRGARPGRYRLPSSVVKAARRASQDELRTMLGEDSLRIAARLEKLQAGELSEKQSEQVQHGFDAFSLARRISEDDSAREDDLAGAMVLFDIAEHDLNAVQSAVGAEDSGPRSHRGRRGTSESTSQGRTELGLCVINPRHGRAKTARKLPRMEKFASVSVPMCRQCVSAAAEGRRMQWLQVNGKPYPERDSVWGNTLYGAAGSDLVADVIRARAMGTD